MRLTHEGEPDLREIAVEAERLADVQLLHHREPLGMRQIFVFVQANIGWPGGPAFASQLEDAIVLREAATPGTPNRLRSQQVELALAPHDDTLTAPLDLREDGGGVRNKLVEFNRFLLFLRL